MSDTRPWLVMKFGGTSVGSAERMLQVARIVRAACERYRPIVVLSAMSSQTKGDGTTSRLLMAADRVLQSATPFSSTTSAASANGTSPTSPLPTSRYGGIVDAIEADHVAAARDAIPDEFAERRDAVIADLRGDLKSLRNFLDAAEIIDEISPRSRDVIIGTGERLVCRLFAAVLASQHCPAAFVTLQKCLDVHMANRGSTIVSAPVVDQGFYDQLRRRVSGMAMATAYGNGDGDSQTFKVPVVTGFMGFIPGGIIDTIGRGYTDFTAALIAAGIKTWNEEENSSNDHWSALFQMGRQRQLPKFLSTFPQPVTEVQIWKEVDGIFTADPRRVPSAQLLLSIYPDEAAELTYYGSEVIHPFTMEQVIRAKVPIRIKNTFSPDGPGTVILPDDDYRSNTEVHVDHHAAGRLPQLRSGESLTATAVTLKTNVICLNIHSNRKSVSHGFLATIFSHLDRHGVVVDLISTSEVHVSMAISNTSNRLFPTTNINCDTTPLATVTSVSSPDSLKSPSGPPSKMEMILRDLRPLGTVSMLTGMAILSLVGRKMKNSVGIAGKMFSTLAEARVNIEMISQGASEINISCVILEEDTERALRRVHDACVLGQTI